MLGPSGRPGFAKLAMRDGAVPVLDTSVDPATEGMLFRFQMLWLDTVGPTPFQLSNGLQLALGTATPH